MTGIAYLSRKTFLKFSHAHLADLNALRCQVFCYRGGRHSTAIFAVGCTRCTPFRVGLTAFVGLSTTEIANRNETQIVTECPWKA